MKNLHAIDANIGHIHHSEKGLKLIMTSIATKEKAKLFLEVNKGNPLSIMMDTYQVKIFIYAFFDNLFLKVQMSQDVKGRHLLGVIFMMLYGGVPSIKFYRLIELESDLKSQAMFDALILEMEKDGVHVAVQTNLIGLAADGASVNFGKYESVYTKLMTWTGRSLEKIWCFGHR